MNSATKRAITIAVSFVVGLIFIVSFVGYKRIEAGHVGIRVNLYGSDKGVDDIVEVTGAQWYFPVRTQIFEFPTFVQNAVYTKDRNEGSPINEEFRVTSKDGLVASFDVSLNYRVQPDKVVFIFKKYRKPLDDLNSSVLRNFVRQGFNKSALHFTAEQLFEQRSKFQSMSDSIIRDLLDGEGFIVEQIVLLNEIRLPSSVTRNIEAKVNAKQIALQKEQELLQATAEANKRIAEAKGRAESLKIQADAERYAYEQKVRSLNQLLIQQQFIEKWDGKLPVYGEVPQLFRSVSTGK